jgi:hypothetical protein
MKKENKEAVENMVHCRDSFHVYAQGGAERDGGDGLNRIGAAYSAMAAMNSPVDDLGMPLKQGLETTLIYNRTNLPIGRYRRHPDPTKWYYNADNVTRDQMIPLTAAWALLGTVDLARAHAKERAKRAFFHFSGQNDGANAGPLIIKKWYEIDPPSLSELGTLIRACRAWFLYPLLLVYDLQLLADVAFGRSMSERNLWDSDNQLLPQLLAGIKVYPTPWTLWAKHIYGTKNVLERLLKYHTQGEMLELYKLMEIAYNEGIKDLK